MKNFFLLIVLCLACHTLQAQELVLSTNVLGYADFGTMNIEASYSVARHWSVTGGVKYNPFTFREGEDAVRRRQRTFSAGSRYWPWHIYSGWWPSGAIRYQEYNSGGIVSPETSEGDRFGGSFGAGYTYMLSPHFNVEFGLGLWAGYDMYTTYACPTCGRIVDKGNKYFFLPSDIIVALAFVF